MTEERQGTERSRMTGVEQRTQRSRMAGEVHCYGDGAAHLDHLQ